MKKYKCFYYPVEGEVQAGQRFFESNGELHPMPLPAGEESFSKAQGDKPAKLFLCHKVMDESRPPTVWKYVPIAEVSPEALWVKEGDEFDEQDVCIVPYFIPKEDLNDSFSKGKKYVTADGDVNPDNDGEIQLYGTCWNEPTLLYVHISKLDRIDIAELKGPCGHFH